MRLTINIFKAAVAASCLVIAACGSDSTADSQSSPGSTPAAASILKTAVTGTASLSGTTIPSATEIIDGSDNVWTVADGVIYENGRSAGYSNNVTHLLYVSNTIYQENAAGGWWSWNGSTWVASSDPRKVASANGTTIPSVTQIIDGGGNVWVVSGGVIYENGTLAGFSKNVTQLVYENNVIYQENSAGGWWSWNASNWTASSDPLSGSSNGSSNGASPNGTTIPSVSQIIDSSGNVWTVSGGVVYENGTAAGFSNGVTHVVYENNAIYQENSAGGWWSWNGSTWVSSSDPVSTGTTTTTLAITGSPATSDTVGQPYSFVPTATGGGATLTYSIANMPAWARFNTTTGALTGTPNNTQAGTFSNITISVSNGSASASLPAFSIVVDMGSATLSWSAPTRNTNGTPLTDLAGYTIYYGTDPNDLTQTINVPMPSATSFEVSNLPPGTYYFAVAAYTSIGTQSEAASAGSKTII
jgi:hypothetical protein